jgi:hypothetical protein
MDVGHLDMWSLYMRWLNAGGDLLSLLNSMNSLGHNGVNALGDHMLYGMEYLLDRMLYGMNNLLLSGVEDAPYFGEQRH